jgi:hypothetical protein
MAVKGILAIVDDIEGGDQPFAVPGTSVRDAQGADTAKLQTGAAVNVAPGPHL